MRIAIYWEQESWGGVDSHLLTLLSTWPSIDDKFVLFYNKRNLGFERIRPELEKCPNVRFIEVKSLSFNQILHLLRGRTGYWLIRILLHFLQPIFFVLMTKRLARYFSIEGPFDILLAENGGYPAAWGTLSAIQAAHRIGISVRILLVHHAAVSPALLMGWYEGLVDRMVNRISTAIVCVSHATYQTLLQQRRFDEEKIRFRIIHNDILPVTYSSESTAINLREAMALSDSDLLLGIVGRVELYKGHEDVLFALARLPEAARNRLMLAVIGGGDELEINRLRRIAEALKIGSRVGFLGYISGKSTDLIKQLDLLILATRSFEGFGLTLLEAMYVGTPILATRIGAVPEIIDENIGMLVDPASPADLTLALIDFLDNRKAWITRAKKARTLVEHRGFRMAVELRQLFLECLAMDG